jgi:hypothetical protein
VGVWQTHWCNNKILKVLSPQNPRPQNPRYLNTQLLYITTVLDFVWGKNSLKTVGSFMEPGGCLRFLKYPEPPASSLNLNMVFQIPGPGNFFGSENLRMTGTHASLIDSRLFWYPELAGIARNQIPAPTLVYTLGGWWWQPLGCSKSAFSDHEGSIYWIPSFIKMIPSLAHFFQVTLNMKIK